MDARGCCGRCSVACDWSLCIFQIFWISDGFSLLLSISQPFCPFPAPLCPVYFWTCVLAEEVLVLTDGASPSAPFWLEPSATRVLFSICLFHATLHQPLTCGRLVVHEAGRSIQSKSGGKLTPIFPLQESGCSKRDPFLQSFLFFPAVCTKTAFWTPCFILAGGCSNIRGLFFVFRFTVNSI